MAAWRRLTPSDIEGLMRVADEVHPGLPESSEIFIERVQLYPEGCLALEENGQICGYAISHPIRQGQAPALNSLLGTIASDADQYYIHDVAILPRLRGRNLAAEGIGRLLAVASRYPATCLVSVYGTESFWGRFDFVSRPVDGGLREKLRAYGDDSVYLSRENDLIEAKKEDFYRYTTKRWLANDKQEAGKRYRRFSIEELVSIAVGASGKNIDGCARITKYQEGQYNKTFLLTLNDGSEVVAKLPNPNAGPEVLTIASEVATMDFVRNIIGLPVLRVLSWSCNPVNPVGSEYIIMEKARGTALGDVWYRLPSPSKHKIIQQVVALETKLVSTSFPAHGCIYYPQDLPSKHSKYLIPLDGDSPRRFRVGPVVDPVFWLDGRAGMELSRGPWLHMTDYATHIGNNEKIWATQKAQPRMDYYRSNIDCESPSEYLDLLEKYLLLVPHITRNQPEFADLLQPTLWHSDLHLNNVYVDLDTETITDIIDWQNITTAPLILQARFPRMVQHTSPPSLGWDMPEKPDDYETLSEDDKTRADKAYKSALCHKYYEVLTAKKNPRLYAAIRHNTTWKSPHVLPIKSVAGAWSSREVFGLRASLMDVVEHWSELQSAHDCPISFAEEEKKLHSEEMENREYIEQLMERFQDAGILPMDGIVDPEHFETLQQTSRRQKELFLSLAENFEERGWMEKIWPYQDRPDEA
ncbi:uncharacterized protein BO97DRAFT_439377 [Aspergillus homomorphus CBS 101889]|uniref:Altered inheritance of mitochondria protein 9, mitochondrial n=1 Tax=Aspergillus homomorphus (strain CBS 101889) TaxID=1450537 RepID=A0A395IEA6_ASPHC|nr:hypothetical protein BO97DRAFT_439377 [Aspergillus homomorphus CBS 101889]RAL17488.1 hypothetical protein BO97DRAFT_439377 [Aspergillus homomorphus CBS 101889]